MFVFTQADVVRLLTMRECIEAVRQALITLSRGDAVLPLRPIMKLPGKGKAVALMPGYLGSPESIGVKVITFFSGNEGTPWDSHQGAVLLFEPEHGELVAVADASTITAIRTAAASAVATDVLARPDAGDLTILGSGVQARSHLEAMLAIRPIRRIRVWSLNDARARAFAERKSKRFGVDVEVAASAATAVKDADIICTTTSASKPILKGEWIGPGTHLNVVGSSIRTSREVDSATMKKARVFTDRRESCLNEAGDFIIPRDKGEISDDHLLGEIGELLLGKVAGRTSPDDVTLFKSLGVAVEDLAAIHLIYRKALATGGGTRLEFGGKREIES